MEEKSDEEVQEAALQVLRNIYGKAVQQPVACAVTRWAQDPYSKGEACTAQGYCTLQRTIQSQSAHSYSGVQYMLCDSQAGLCQCCGARLPCSCSILLKSDAMTCNTDKQCTEGGVHHASCIS